jgi:hypothetical protein
MLNIGDKVKAPNGVIGQVSEIVEAQVEPMYYIDNYAIPYFENELERLNG